MKIKPTWRSSLVLIWLLAAGQVKPAPTAAKLEPAFKTQYPPADARVAAPQTQGFYPTSLEREGHLLQKPTKGPLKGDLGLDNLLDVLEHPDSLLGWLLPGAGANTAEPEAPVNVPATTPAALPTSQDTKPLTTPAAIPTSATPTRPTSNPKPDSSPEQAPTSKPSITAAKPEPSSSDQPPVQSPAPTSSSSIASSSPTNQPEQPSTPDASTPAAPSSPSSTPKSSPSIQGPATPMADNQDVFIPVATGPVPNTIKSRNDHPVPRKGIVNSTVPIETNKFYSGLFLGTQSNATFTHPYAVSWSKGTGTLQSYGMAVSHVESNVMALGPTNNHIPGNPVSYYVNPIGIQSIILSASELNASTVLTTENPLPFSANAVLRPQSGSAQSITVPVVQGMGFVTGIYSGLQPVVQSGVHFDKVVSAGSPKSGIYKYTATLADQATWLIYAIPQDGKDPDFRLESSTSLRGPAGWSGTIQVAKNPAGASGEKFFDNSSGVYALEGAVSGAVSDQTGTYNLAWAKAGKDVQSTPLLMFALPHHIESFDSSTKGRVTNITIRTTTKGQATAVIGEIWTMNEPDLPVGMGFAPWSTSQGSVDTLSAAAQKVILEAAPTELKQDVGKESDLNSMYFSGKALSKFATLVYTVNKLGGNPQLADSAFKALKDAFARFVNNQQQYPLVYDNVWKGVVSSASYDGGDTGADFGNTLYNDHHFHYGYFIHAAAIIGTLDPTWLPANKEWVNVLVRDAGNSAANDAYFPFSRGFDWFHGHSWAKGLFESFDGKDEESTSEDAMFAYSLKVWGKTIGDASMEARGNLMLGILRRTLHNYFLLESDNKNHPESFVPNKVTGILFENKVDHTTYFGANLEYIQGIHMLPLLPSSAFVRRQKFVQEEWNAMFASNASTPAEKVQAGWKGVLYANLAIIDPVASWKFFADSNFDYSWIDGGATRTWYLAYAAGLGGA
ncbi:endo-1,3-beta glucanase [Aspergillus melleus]|uniref:Endo-1,3-beta glucanase n=1 Tax=Aspergillus melleus TaxID=138277 RepID=A0ACC3BER8_9EURO|nr:endo-1,3-beta glucanase [Aspergillus melleus]